MDKSVVLEGFNYQYLIANQHVLQNLCDVYCSIWERDPNFAEYRRCPSCAQYFSYEQVELQGQTECPMCQVALKKAWLPVSIALDLLEQSKEHSFSGILLLREGEVVGFSWGLLYTYEQMGGRYGESFDILRSQNSIATVCFYLKELAVIPEMRGKGYGSKMVKAVLLQPLCRYPNSPAALGTHQNSPSVSIYNKLGFTKLVDHPAGQGRIRMGIGRIADINMFR